MEHLGGCHCGNLRLRLGLSKAPGASPLRACACSFCRRRVANWMPALIER